MKKILTKNILLVAFLAACGTATNIPQETDMNNQITVNHLSGVTEVPINPQRVAVFDLGILDTLNYFGIYENIIGVPIDFVPRHLQHFADENNFVRLGTMHDPNFEELVLHDIDLIIISGRARPHFNELSALAPTIDLGLIQGDMLESFISNNTYIGQIFGIEEAMQVELEKIQTEIENLSQEANQLDLSALIIMYSDGGLRAFGPNGRFGIIHDHFGFRTVDEHIDVVNHGVVVTNEYLLNTNPDIMFIIVRDYALSDFIPVDDIENEIVQLTNAWINNNIVYLNSDIWYIGNGGIGGMWEQIAEMRYTIENSRLP